MLRVEDAPAELRPFLAGRGDEAADLRDQLRQRKIMVNARGGGLRVSPHFYNTEAELDKVIALLSGPAPM